jgi:hypothetical protein
VTTSNTNHSGKKPVAIIESAAEAVQQKLYSGEVPRNYYGHDRSSCLQSNTVKGDTTIICY